MRSTRNRFLIHGTPNKKLDKSSSISNNNARRYSTIGSECDSLKTFQFEIDSLLNRKESRKRKAIESLEHSRFQTIADSTELIGVKNELSNLKIRVQTIKRQALIQTKLSSIETELVKQKAIEGQLKSQKQQYNLPVINPAQILPPMYPYPMQSPFFNNHSLPIYDRSYEEDMHQNAYEVPHVPYRSPYMKNSLQPRKTLNRQKHYNRLLTRQQLRKKMKNVFRAVAFIVFLKRLNNKTMKRRKQLYNKYWPESFKTVTGEMRKQLAKNNRKFFMAMLQKSNAQLTIHEEDSIKLKEEKTATIKVLFKLLCKGIGTTFAKLSHSYSFMEALYAFCKHGAYIDNGVLTVDQIDTVCISELHGYLRADSNIQKSHIINFLLIKVMIFNMILQPWKIDSTNFNTTQETLTENFYFFGGLFYRIIQGIQDYLLGIPKAKCYKVGNWDQIKQRVKCCASLIYPNKEHQRGQMISGLMSERQYAKLFEKGIFKSEKLDLLDVLDSLHKSLIAFHKEFINKIMNQTVRKDVDVPYQSP